MKRPLNCLLFVLLCILSLLTVQLLRDGTSLGIFSGPIQKLGQLWSKIDHADGIQVSTGPQQASIHSEAGQETSPLTRSENTSPKFGTHASMDGEACNLPSSKSPTDVPARLVYKWTDQNGQRHLSDTPPEDQIATVIDIAGARQEFTYRINAENITLPLGFEGVIAAGSKRMYDTWHFLLGREQLKQSAIVLNLLSPQSRYDAVREQLWPNSQPSSGFYSLRHHQAYVHYEPDQTDNGLRTSLHEISHLITATHLGPTPPWLTEGMAEYFENIAVQGQGGVVNPNRHHLRRLESSQLPRIGQFLAMRRDDWNSADRDLNYAVAWSLMFFLMKGDPGIYAMQEVIRNGQQHFCRPFSYSDALIDAYPGGLQRLERDWKVWLSSDNIGTVQT